MTCLFRHQAASISLACTLALPLALGLGHVADAATPGPAVAVTVTSGGVTPTARDSIAAVIAHSRPVYVITREGQVRDRIDEANPQTELDRVAGVTARPPAADPGWLDLARVLQTALDVCSVSPARKLDLFIIGRAAHRDARDDLRNGRSNGGHYFLPDNEFAALRAGGCAGLAVHVVPPPKLNLSNIIDPTNDEQFLQLVLQNRLSIAQLVTYSADGTVGQRGHTYPDSFDRGVTRTAVVPGSDIPSEAPPCPANAVPLSWSKNEETTYTWTVTSQADPACLAGARLDVVVNGERRTLQGDERGVFSVTARFVPGPNRLAVLIPGQGEHLVYEHVMLPRTDQIDIALDRAGSNTATVMGFNPLRPRSSRVAIEHDGSGRTYTANVDDEGHFTARVQLQPGRNSFRIAQLSGEKLVTTVDNGKVCDDQPSQEVQRGTLVLALQNSCRIGKSVTFTYQGNVWQRVFAPNGRAEVKIPLVGGPNHDVWFSTQDGNKRLLQIFWDNGEQLLTVTLAWKVDGRRDLDLHVLEPGATFDSPGHIFFGNLTGSNLGALDIDDLGDATGSIHEEHYVVSRAALKAHGGTIQVFVDDFTRYDGGDHRTALPPYCGNNREARVPFTITIRDGNKPADIIERNTPAITCGERPTTQQRLMPVRTITIN